MTTYLKSLRKNQNVSQEFLAKKIGISRPTYIQIEKSKRKMLVEEAQKLAKFFGLSLEDFLAEKRVSTQKVELEKTKKKIEPKNQEVRISVPQEKIDKFVEVFLKLMELEIVTNYNFLKLIASPFVCLYCSCLTSYFGIILPHICKRFNPSSERYKSAAKRTMTGPVGMFM